MFLLEQGLVTGFNMEREYRFNMERESYLINSHGLSKTAIFQPPKNVQSAVAVNYIEFVVMFHYLTTEGDADSEARQKTHYFYSDIKTLVRAGVIFLSIVLSGVCFFLLTRLN